MSTAFRGNAEMLPVLLLMSFNDNLFFMYCLTLASFSLENHLVDCKNPLYGYIFTRAILIIMFPVCSYAFACMNAASL